MFLSPEQAYGGTVVDLNREYVILNGDGIPTNPQLKAYLDPDSMLHIPAFPNDWYGPFSVTLQYYVDADVVEEHTLITTFFAITSMQRRHIVEREYKIDIMLCNVQVFSQFLVWADQFDETLTNVPYEIGSGATVIDMDYP